MKIVLENNQKMALHLNVPGKTGVKRIVIPSAKPDKETKQIVNGRAEVNGELVEQARKNSEIVRNYFSNGWLREVGVDAEPAEKAA